MYVDFKRRRTPGSFDTPREGRRRERSGRADTSDVHVAASRMLIMSMSEDSVPDTVREEVQAGGRDS